MRPLNSLAVRLVAGALLWSLAGFLIAGIVLASLFRGAVERSLDDRLGTVAQNLLAVMQIEDEGPGRGALSLRRPLADGRFDRVFSGWYWQIDALPPTPERRGGREERGPRRAVARSRSLFDEMLDLPPLDGDIARGTFLVDGPDGQTLRVLTTRVGLPGADRPYQLAIAADISSMRKEIADFQTVLIWSLVIMSIVLVLMLLIQIRIGLAPLAQVRSDLAAVRSGRTTRLSGKFPAEIAPLADELNRVLDHNGAVIERARTQVGNLAHALKTPLSVLSNAAVSALDTKTGDAERDLGVMVREQTAVMRRQVDRYLALARTAASAQVLGARCLVDPVIDDITRTLARIRRGPDIILTRLGPQGLAVRGERGDVEEVVGNLLDNAYKWAASAVRITTAREADMVRLIIEDDGPGLSDGDRETALTRGGRLDETKPGSGLGLSIVGDIVDAYQGDVQLGRSDLGGLKVTVDLPRAGASQSREA